MTHQDVKRDEDVGVRRGRIINHNTPDIKQDFDRAFALIYSSCKCSVLTQKEKEIQGSACYKTQEHAPSVINVWISITKRDRTVSYVSS